MIDRALRLPIAELLTGRPVHVIAVGKAAAAMASAFLSLRLPSREREGRSGQAVYPLQVQQALAIGTHTHPDLPTSVEWIESSHPFPDAPEPGGG